eukprot:CAMPEP_0181234934 /NCGR_PEP_ID=MMETSP1096-20121128/37274_1 /TAXON_ID=156174 ORGANISM="Chrysochromulina ericina, Strain CCMP281" /NCGR_SAMPLE_ID=MMETSP1096 /ASSEMBLY_ACC=CAM_ASM_000453 /LENGTH=103 /DNA_ID=CAMNT_0023329815 /DNA_START=153 /DNA_END=464 /DNA_ORIENTATION=-
MTAAPRQAAIIFTMGCRDRQVATRRPRPFASTGWPSSSGGLSAPRGSVPLISNDITVSGVLGVSEPSASVLTIPTPMFVSVPAAKALSKPEHQRTARLPAKSV